MDWLLLDRHDERRPLAGAMLVVTGALLLGCWNTWQTLQDFQNGTATMENRAIDGAHSADIAEGTTVPMQNAATEHLGVSIEAEATDTPYFSVSADEPPKPAGPGLSIAPSYNLSGEFEGYLVQGRSGDYRFNHGDIITAINQTPVEDSAAGSELLLIALAQPDMALATRDAAQR